MWGRRLLPTLRRQIHNRKNSSPVIFFRAFVSSKLDTLDGNVGDSPSQHRDHKGWNSGMALARLHVSSLPTTGEPSYCGRFDNNCCTGPNKGIQGYCTIVDCCYRKVCGEISAPTLCKQMGGLDRCTGVHKCGPCPTTIT